MVNLRLPMLALAIATAPVAAHAEDAVVLVIKDHRFEPEELHVPAGKKVKLLVKNQDATSEEFDSGDLNREKVIPGNGEAAVYIGPLDKGRYSFFGEYNQDTAQGVVVAE